MAWYGHCLSHLLHFSLHCLESYWLPLNSLIKPSSVGQYLYICFFFHLALCVASSSHPLALICMPLFKMPFLLPESKVCPLTLIILYQTTAFCSIVAFHRFKRNIGLLLVCYLPPLFCPVSTVKYNSWHKGGFKYPFVEWIHFHVKEVIVRWGEAENFFFSFVLVGKLNKSSAFQ